MHLFFLNPQSSSASARSSLRPSPARKSRAPPVDPPPPLPPSPRPPRLLLRPLAGTPSPSSAPLGKSGGRSLSPSCCLRRHRREPSSPRCAAPSARERSFPKSASTSRPPSERAPSPSSGASTSRTPRHSPPTPSSGRGSRRPPCLSGPSLRGFRGGGWATSTG